MNPRWLLIRRLRGPAFLLTFAVTALLNQWDIWGFGQSWPLYLIVAGVLTLAERAALANTPLVPYGDPGMGQPYGQPPYGQTYGGQAPYGVPTPGQAGYQPVQPAGTSVVPVAPTGWQKNDPEGRQ